MNSVNLIGRACAVPTLRYVGQTNRPLAEFTLAVDDHFNKDPQTGKPSSYFFLCLLWGNKAELAHSHIVTGQRLGVSGRITQEKFTPRDSTHPVTKTRIIAETFTLLDKPRSHTSAAETPSLPPAEEGDHIPF
jgi:single-strand DNA-binding protein